MDAGHGAGPGRREEHLEGMGAFLHSRALPASKLLLSALEKIPHDGRNYFPKNKTPYSSGGAGCAARTMHVREGPYGRGEENANTLPRVSWGEGSFMRRADGSH